MVRTTATLYVSQEDIRVNRDLNMNIDGSAREHTKIHTCQTEADRAGAIYFVRRKFCFL